jgi:hypothetical protein
MRHLMPVKEAQQQLGGISPTTFYALVKDGELSLIKICRSSFVHSEELDDFLTRKRFRSNENCRVSPSTRTPSSQVEPLTQASVLVGLIHGWRVYRDPDNPPLGIYPAGARGRPPAAAGLAG